MFLLSRNKLNEIKCSIKALVFSIQIQSNGARAITFTCVNYRSGTFRSPSTFPLFAISLEMKSMQSVRLPTVCESPEAIPTNGYYFLLFHLKLCGTRVSSTMLIQRWKYCCFLEGPMSMMRKGEIVHFCALPLCSCKLIDSPKSICGLIWGIDRKQNSKRFNLSFSIATQLCSSACRGVHLLRYTFEKANGNRSS